MPEKQQNDVISGFIGILFVIAGITWLMGFGGFLIGVGLIFLLVAAV